MGEFLQHLGIARGLQVHAHLREFALDRRNHRRQDIARLGMGSGQQQAADMLAALVGGVAADVGGLRQDPARMFDRFGALKLADRNARLDNFAIQLQNDPTDEGYIIGYGGRKSVKGAVAASLKKMKDYLGWTRGIELTRIVIVDLGIREASTTELWIVPRGSTPPRPPPPAAKKKTTVKKKQ